MPLTKCVGIFAMWADFDWTEARRRFDIAFSREPVSPMLRHLYGYFYLRLTGKPLDAIAQNRRALEEYPLNLAMRIGLAVSLTAAGKHEEALTEARRILELDPTFVPAYSLLALDVTKAPLPEALDYAEKGYALSPWYPINVGLLAGMLVRSGDPARAAKLIQGLGEGRASGAPVGFAIFHLLCGETEKAAEWMEKAIEQRHNMVVMLLLAPLRKRPRRRFETCISRGMRAQNTGRTTPTLRITGWRSRAFTSSEGLA
jgi:predicted Zn-dependent protease